MISNTCIAFGSFEFVHKGHLKVAETVVDIARERGLTSVVVSMEPEGEVYTTEEEKEYLLKKAGVEMVVSFGEVDPGMVIGLLAAKVVVVGENHPKMEEVKLAAETVGAEVVTVPTVCEDGEEITIERVKEAFDGDNFEKVTALCGHPFVMIGEVVHGKALGRTENMPTANIQVVEQKKRPSNSVYAARICLGDEHLDTVTHIGRRPSVDHERHVTIESLILDFDRNIYGEKLVLEIHKRIRGIRKFDNLAEVKEQVDKDIEEAKGFWASIDLLNEK